MTEHDCRNQKPKARRPYSKPELDELGDFFHITQSGGTTDGGTGGKGGVRRDGGPGSPKTKSGSSG